MFMVSNARVIEDIKKAAEGIIPSAEVYLFGSRSRSTATKDSDFDILILLDLPELSFETETQLMDTFYEVELATGAVISPLIYPKKEWLKRKNSTPLFKNIQREGIRL